MLCRERLPIPQAFKFNNIGENKEKRFIARISLSAKRCGIWKFDENTGNCAYIP